MEKCSKYWVKNVVEKMSIPDRGLKLKQISLHVFLKYCTNILVVDFVYFLSDFLRSRSSDANAFFKNKKNVFKRFQNSKENFL